MNGALHDDKMEQARVPSRASSFQRDAERAGRRASARGRRLSRNEAAMGFKLDPREIGWAPYVMIGGGLGVGMFVLAVAMFLKHAG
jgi:hypothetical protein